ncbi:MULTISPECIES: tetratricopeptide repeat protein, partial [unclassified Frankia]|uniref:tetratricopeptide repeat protein n=1 Tax=unclassified Frankia TaxID=2632575 RepID=UPI001EF50AD4
LAVRLGDTDKAREYYEQDLAIALRLAEADPVNAGKQRDVMISLRQLGGLLSGMGEHERGQAMLSEAVEIARRIGIDLDVGLGVDPSQNVNHNDRSGRRRRRWPFGRRGEQ